MTAEEMKKILKEEFGIQNEKELIERMNQEKKLDIGMFVSERRKIQ